MLKIQREKKFDGVLVAYHDTNININEVMVLREI
jgi:hypothetical protein